MLNQTFSSFLASIFNVVSTYETLFKEMAKKKGKPAEPPPKLTKKQEEVLQAQLKKESEIRAKLTLVRVLSTSLVL